MVFDSVQTKNLFMELHGNEPGQQVWTRPSVDQALLFSLGLKFINEGEFSVK